jgi:hypothetical protein
MDKIQVTVEELQTIVNQLNAGILPMNGSLQNLITVVNLLNSLSSLLDSLKGKGLSADAIRELKVILDPLADFIKAVPTLLSDLKNLDSASMITISIQLFNAAKKLGGSLSEFFKKSA